MGAGGQTHTIKKLQQALLFEGETVLITTSQFFSLDKHKFVTRYHIKKQVYEPGSDRKSSIVELFNSCSQIQVTLFLRDYFYTVKGIPVPTDNPVWEEAKAKWAEEHS